MVIALLKKLENWLLNLHADHTLHWSIDCEDIIENFKDELLHFVIQCAFQHDTQLPPTLGHR